MRAGRARSRRSRPVRSCGRTARRAAPPTRSSSARSRDTAATRASGSCSACATISPATSSRVRALVGDDEHFRRTREAVDAADAEHLALRFGDVDVAGPDDLVDGRDRRRPVRERGDRLRAAGGVQLVDAGQRAREQHGRVHAAVALRRRHDDDALDAGDLRRNHRHQHRRGQRRAAARDVRADRGERPGEERVARAVGVAVLDRSGQLSRVEVGDAFARESRGRARSASRHQRARSWRATGSARAAPRGSRPQSPNAACSRPARRRRARARRRGSRARLDDDLRRRVPAAGIEPAQRRAIRRLDDRHAVTARAGVRATP